MKSVFLEAANQNLKVKYEEAIIEAEANHEQINQLTFEKENLFKQLDNERSKSE